MCDLKLGPCTWCIIYINIDRTIKLSKLVLIDDDDDDDYDDDDDDVVIWLASKTDPA